MSTNYAALQARNPRMPAAATMKMIASQSRIQMPIAKPFTITHIPRAMPMTMSAAVAEAPAKTSSKWK